MSALEGSNVRIVSGGTHATTKVLVDGVVIQHVSRLEILPMEGPGGVVRAVIEVIGPDVDMVAQLAHAEVITVKVDAAEASRMVNAALRRIAEEVQHDNPEMSTRLLKIADGEG